MAESLETTVARIDERMSSMETLIGNIAHTMNELSHTHSRILVIESELLTLKTSNEKLWKRLEKTEHAVYGSGWKIVTRLMEWSAMIAIGYAINKLNG